MRSLLPNGGIASVAESHRSYRPRCGCADIRFSLTIVLYYHYPYSEADSIRKWEDRFAVFQSADRSQGFKMRA